MLHNINTIRSLWRKAENNNAIGYSGIVKARYNELQKTTIGEKTMTTENTKTEVKKGESRVPSMQSIKNKVNLLVQAKQGMKLDNNTIANAELLDFIDYTIQAVCNPFVFLSDEKAVSFFLKFGQKYCDTSKLEQLAYDSLTDAQKRIVDRMKKK